MSAQKAVPVIDLGCGAVSPALIVDGAEPRFSCSRQQGHSGAHSVTLSWDSEPMLLDAPPWRGLESEVAE